MSSTAAKGCSAPAGADEGVPPWYYYVGAGEEVAAGAEMEACGVACLACQRHSEVGLNPMHMVVSFAGAKVLTLAITKCVVAKPQCDCVRCSAARRSWSWTVL